MVLFIVIKTLTFNYQRPQYEAVTVVDVPELAIDRFQESIRYKTVSYLEKEKRDTSQFIAFQEFLARSYPLIDSLLEKRTFGYSLLYTWPGSDPSEKGVVLMGHFDVVPVDENTLHKWEAGPFSGEIIDGRIIGRGSMDDKVNVIALMETVELLLKEGFQPKQNIHLSLGHDEEVGGNEGAKEIANYLKNSGEGIAFAMDEGGYIAENMIPGINIPIAIINTGEKGYVSYKLTINTPGGHSSRPPKDNTIGSLARALVKLEDNQFPFRSIPVIDRQLNIMGPHFEHFRAKMAFANTWLFGSTILEQLHSHTTTAPTMLSGGVKDNVIPTEASAVVNFRIMPGETVQDVHDHIISVIDDDRIRLESISNTNEPSPISDDQSDTYRLIEKTIYQLFPDVVVSPGLLGAGTDSKHFIGVADNVYRFYPTRVNPKNANGFHGNNEFIPVTNYIENIQFNYQLIKNLSL